MTKTQETLYTIFDLCIKSKLAPLLKEKGFKKKGYVWNRRREDFVDVIEFQISRKCSDEKMIDFTINFAVGVPEARAEIFGEKTEGFFFKESNCIIWARPGGVNLDPEIIPRDAWWKVSSKEEIERTFDEIENLLKTKAFVFMEYFDSMEKIGEFMLKKRKKSFVSYSELIQVGIVLFWAGKKKEAQELLMEIINKKIGWSEKATLVAQKLGLNI